MKQFNLVEALTGKPVCDRDGNKVTNFRVRTDNDKFCAGDFEDYPFVGDAGGGCTHSYTACGVYSLFGKSSHDLFMLDEQSEDNQEIELLKERLRNLEDQLKENSVNEVDPYKEFKDAIAQGKEVQVKSRMNEEWMSLKDTWIMDWSDNEPDFYRIKPETMRYRLYEWKSTNTVGLGIVQSAYQESAVSSAPNFVKWLTDWVEIELSA